MRFLLDLAKSSSDCGVSSDPVRNAMRLIHFYKTDSDYSGYDGYMRASTIAVACPREEYLGYKYNLVRRDMAASDPSLRVVFDIGTAVHKFIQNNRSYFGDSRIGWWKCLACGSKVFGRMIDSMSCERCGAGISAIEYHEHSFRLDSPVRVSGHVDMLVDFGGAVRILDIKTIDRDAFLDLDTPHHNNVLQVICYMNYINMSGIPVKVAEDYALLLYVSKGYTKNSFPMKCFVVKNDEFLFRSVEAKLKAFTDAVNYGILPKPMDECVRSDFSVYRAKVCPASDVCKRLHCE